MNRELYVLLPRFTKSRSQQECLRIDSRYSEVLKVELRSFKVEATNLYECQLKVLKLINFQPQNSDKGARSNIAIKLF